MSAVLTRERMTFRNVPQHRVARKVAVFIVDLLKVDSISDHRQRLCLFQLGLLVLEVAAPVRACHRIR